MEPSSDIPMIASSDDCKIAASNCSYCALATFRTRCSFRTGRAFVLWGLGFSEVRGRTCESFNDQMIANPRLYLLYYITVLYDIHPDHCIDQEEKCAAATGTGISGVDHRLRHHSSSRIWRCRFIEDHRQPHSAFFKPLFRYRGSLLLVAFVARDVLLQKSLADIVVVRATVYRNVWL